MAIVARLTTEGWECVNEIAHITVGTRAPAVKPKESNDLLHRWLREGSSEESGLRDAVIKSRVEVEGSVKGILSR